LAVIDRVFGLRVREVEPLLQEVNPQHLLQSQRLAAIAGLGIVRLDQLQQTRPRNHRVHLRQKALTPSPFPLRAPGHRSKRPLTTHPPASASADRPRSTVHESINLCRGSLVAHKDLVDSYSIPLRG